jgi:hypothetical protein
MRPSRRISRRVAAIAFAAVAILVACVAPGTGDAQLHRWWAGLGPVLPHDSFPADCNLCHLGEQWQELRASFSFDHAKETGFELRGAHSHARCLRCHNDRGPVATFQARGCAGCHEDPHFGKVGNDCASCHTEVTWRALAQFERHQTTRFPLTGAHANTACHRCHPGALAGEFVPTDVACVTCHRADLEGTTNPPHIPLGWIDNCDRCHQTVRWPSAQIR